MSKKLTIGLSACLAGEKVRFDAGHRRDDAILNELGKCFNFQTFCPEMAIGMGVPRQTIRLVESSQGLRAVGVKDPSLDVTHELKTNAKQQSVWVKNLAGFIVKKGSPSCGMERVKIYGEKRVLPEGRGLFTEEIIKAFPLLPVEEEGRLKNPLLLDSFIHRVYAYAEWNRLCKEGLTVHKLVKFHTQYKMILLSRNQVKYRFLGRLVANAVQKNIKELSLEYIQVFMDTLKQPATRNGHVNVLQHLQGFLKRQLPAEEKRNLISIIDRYAKGELPLIAPKLLLNMHFDKHTSQFINDSLYLKPYPVELGIYTKL